MPVKNKETLEIAPFHPWALIEIEKIRIGSGTLRPRLLKVLIQAIFQNIKELGVRPDFSISYRAYQDFTPRVMDNESSINLALHEQESNRNQPRDVCGEMVLPP